MNNLRAGWHIGLLSFTLLALNTLVWGILILLPFTLIKIIIRVPIVTWCADKVLVWMMENWAASSVFFINLCIPTQVQISGDHEFSREEWYLLVANHQSWVDIMILFQVLNKKVSPMKYFLKQELIWLPVIGLACWALDFPFMKRYSKSYLKKYPEKKGKDVEETKKQCEKYRTKPITVINFIEGTRFRPYKHKAQNSPYQHLLKPKAGGVGFVMTAMGDMMHKVIDVTIAYPDSKKEFWDYCCGRVSTVSVHIDVVDIAPELLGDYINDTEYRSNFQSWMNDIWIKKDDKIKALLCTQES